MGVTPFFCFLEASMTVTTLRRLLSRAEVAELLGLSIRTGERLEERGDLAPVHIGRRVLYQPAAVDRYVARLAAAENGAAAR